MHRLIKCIYLSQSEDPKPVLAVVTVNYRTVATKPVLAVATVYCRTVATKPVLAVATVNYIGLWRQSLYWQWPQLTI